jgi:hypothetical protein
MHIAIIDVEKILRYSAIALFLTSVVVEASFGGNEKEKLKDWIYSDRPELWKSMVWGFMAMWGDGHDRVWVLDVMF